MKLNLIRFWTLGGWFTWVAVAIGGSAILGAVVSSSNNSKNLSAEQQGIAQEQAILGGLNYQPIDIKQLQQQATAASIADATNSLALQRSLQPNVAASNDALAASVASQLKQGGNLSPDVANQVAEAARTSNGVSGATGNASPITAALIGQSSLGLLQQRQQAAEALSAANPAPSVGLSAQDIASATEANNNAENQFALAKAGASSNLINSGVQAQTSYNSGQAANLLQLTSLLSLLGTRSPTSSTIQPTGSTTIPSSATLQSQINAPSGFGSTGGSLIGGGS